MCAILWVCASLNLLGDYRQISVILIFLSSDVFCCCCFVFFNAVHFILQKLPFLETHMFKCNKGTTWLITEVFWFSLKHLTEICAVHVEFSIFVANNFFAKLAI